MYTFTFLLIIKYKHNCSRFVDTNFKFVYKNVFLAGGLFIKYF